MKLISSNVEYIPQGSGLEGIYKQIELCGRTCYKSEDKITDTSAESFVDRLLNAKHTAMLEHGTVYLKIEEDKEEIYGVFDWDPHSIVTFDGAYAYVTTNLRVITGKLLFESLKYLCDPTEYHERRYTFKFICSRGISHELVRHRLFSFAQESQRYCNYSKDKFGNELTFIKPYWFDDADLDTKVAFTDTLEYDEARYFELLEKGLKPQDAREILPNATKTEICMTGFEEDWEQFLKLRYFEKTGKVHPDMKILAQKVNVILANEIYKN